MLKGPGEPVILEGPLTLLHCRVTLLRVDRPGSSVQDRFQGLGYLCRVALFYPVHPYSGPIWHASSVSTWFMSESDSSPLLCSKVWAVPPCLVVDVIRIKFLDSVSFWSPSLGTQSQVNIDSLHTSTRAWTLAHTYTLSEYRNARHLWCKGWGVHSAVTLLGCTFGLCDFMALDFKKVT